MKKLLLSCLICFSTISYADGAYALYDYDQHEYQVSFNTYEVRPIASITKLFTAITILRSGVELTEKVRVKGKSGGRFPNGTMVSRPNAYIKGRGLLNTSIEEPTGLSKNNVSTAIELISFIGAIKDNEALKSYADEKTADILIPRGKKQVHIKLHNTNPSIFKFDNILLSKTGYTNPAGRCVVMLVEKDRKYYGIVVLGQKNAKERSELANVLITEPPLPTKPVVREADPIQFEWAM